jgi:hypothetical protein
MSDPDNTIETKTLDGSTVIRRVKDCPTFSGKQEYRNWRERVSDWIIMTKDGVPFQALEIRLSLQNNAYEAVREIERSELLGSGGVKTIMDKLDSVYKKDEMMDRMKKAVDFFSVKKSKEESMREYIVRYEKIVSECESVGGGKMSEELKGSHVMYGAQLSSTEQQIVLGACSLGGYNYDTIKMVLGRVFQETNPGVKKEREWLGEESKKVVKCYKCGNPGHLARECRKEIKCFKCNKEGHFARACTEKMNQDFHCYVCGSIDHAANKCPDSWKNKKDKEQSVKEKVLWAGQDQNVKTREDEYDLEKIEGVIDTGCNKTLCGEL